MAWMSVMGGGERGRRRFCGISYLSYFNLLAFDLARAGSIGAARNDRANMSNHTGLLRIVIEDGRNVSNQDNAVITATVA